MSGAPAAPIDGAEALREALHKLRLEHATLARSSAHAQHLLDALEGLLGLRRCQAFAWTMARARAASSCGGVAISGATWPAGTNASRIRCRAQRPAMWRKFQLAITSIRAQAAQSMCMASA